MVRDSFVSQGFFLWGVWSGGFGLGWAGVISGVLSSAIILYPTPCLPPSSGWLAVVCGSVVVNHVLCLSIAFMMEINLASLLMSFSVPTRFSKWAFLPIPSMDWWLVYFGQSLRMCPCLSHSSTAAYWVFSPDEPLVVFPYVGMPCVKLD